MSGAFFYIEYKNGSVTQIEFKTDQMARKAYNLYEKEPEDNAKGWGWNVDEAMSMAEIDLEEHFGVEE